MMDQLNWTKNSYVVIYTSAQTIICNMSERTFEVQCSEVKGEERYLYLQNQHWHCISLPMVQQQKGNSAYQELLSNFKGKRQTKFTHYHFLQLYKHWRSPGIVKMLQHCKTCILLPKLHVKLERLRTNSPVLQHLYWRSVPCAQLCNIWILQLSSEAIYNNTINTPTFNASHWILQWATSSFTFSSQKVLSKSLYCCFPLKQPW